MVFNLFKWKSGLAERLNEESQVQLPGRGGVRAQDSDLFAVSSAVAFCRYGTGDTTGSTLTGNNTP